MDPIKRAVFEIMNRLTGGPIVDVYAVIREVQRIHPDASPVEIENLVIEEIVERWGSLRRNDGH